MYLLWCSDSVPTSLEQTDGNSNAISAHVTTNKRHTLNEGMVWRDELVTPSRLRRGRLRAKSYCFALLCVFFFFKAIVAAHQCQTSPRCWGEGRGGGLMHFSNSRRSRRERLRGRCFGSVMRALSPHPLSAETQTVAGGQRRCGASLWPGQQEVRSQQKH